MVGAIFGGKDLGRAAQRVRGREEEREADRRELVRHRRAGRVHADEVRHETRHPVRGQRLLFFPLLLFC